MPVLSILAEWEARGKPLQVPAADTRIWCLGSGAAVVCLHGVPTSAYLYRKVLPELAKRGLQGVALDFPGLGFADRPQSFDYSWSGLARWCEKALELAGIEHYHLVVHDIGGPIGFEMAAQSPDRILSLTALNTMVDVASFERPWMMEPFAHPVLNRLWLAPMDTPMFLPIMRYAGVLDTPSRDELLAYGKLLKRGDGGRAFLKIMRGFERTKDYEERIKRALKKRNYPAQVIWGRDDPALKMNSFAPTVCAALGLETWHEVRGKHFLQEDSFVEIGELVANIAS